MSDATLIANDAKNIVQAHLDRLGEPKDNRLSEEAKQQKFAQIEAELKKRDAVLVAHYYCDPDVQELVEKTGGCVSDSLEMARFGRDHAASTLVVAGVKFMGFNQNLIWYCLLHFVENATVRCHNESFIWQSLRSFNQLRSTTYRIGNFYHRLW